MLLPILAICVLASPQPSPSNGVTSGRAAFRRLCAGCHGENAKGGRGPDLTATGQLRWGGSDDAMVRNILGGISGTQMAAFPMPVNEAHAIVGWLRSLRGEKPDEAVTGDVAAGRRLFFESARCSRCHMFGGRGGRLGPDLSGIGDEKTITELKDAILRPSQSLRDGFETVEITTRNGEFVRGVARNQDTFSIQVMDEREQIRSFLKRDLRQVNRIPESLMPAPKLADAELNDVIAFLKKTPPSAIGLSPWQPSPDLDVSFERLRRAPAEPQNWLTYWGDLHGAHYSPLRSITPANVQKLSSRWSFQFDGSAVEVTPIVVDGLMFVTGPLNDAALLDARTGRPIWRYKRHLPAVHAECTNMSNRGFAILGDRLYMGTLDAHLVALDAKTGNVLWDVEVDDYRKGYSITHAPLAIDGKIIVGITAGECAVTGFLDAYDAASGKRLWRIWTVPKPGEPGRSTWAGNSADFGGSPTWMTGTYDPETDTLFWPTGNPGPDYDGSERSGDNLYSCSILALDPNTGKMKWYFQFTPHDTHDWDATETPVLIDADFRGRPRKLLIQANRNSFYYVLDRETGQFLLGKAFVHQNWANGLDDKGHPIVIPGTDPTPQGVYICPDAGGATNWAAPSYDAQTGLFYVAVREICSIYTSERFEPRPGGPFTGTGDQKDRKRGERGAIRAIDPMTGEARWNFPLQIGSSGAGVLSTGGGVVFASSAEGNLIALDARTGAALWHYQTGGEIMSSPISYAVDGIQYVAIANQTALFTFAISE